MIHLMGKLNKWLGIACCSALVISASATALAQTALPLTNGQTLYLPIYSHLYHGDPDSSGKPQEVLVSAHVSIRNTDNRTPLKVISARYFDTEGRMLKEYVPQAQTVAPMGTLELFVPYKDVSGGSGANFVITWTAETRINPPLVEALHSDIRASRALVFVTAARAIQPR